MEHANLSRPGQRDLLDLTDLAVTQGLSISEDIEFQLETAANTMIYERGFFELKAQRLARKMTQEVVPQLEEKRRLRDLLDSLYEGQQLKAQAKELQAYAAKMKKDAIERVAKSEVLKAEGLEELPKSGIEALKKLNAQVREVEIEIERLNETIGEYSNLPNEMGKAMLQLQKVRDEV